MKLFAIAATLILFAPIPSFAGERLGIIFNSEMIGANVSYFEKYTGPARNTYKSGNDINNTYKVDNCEVSVVINNKLVKSIGLNRLSKKCTFDLNTFTPNIGRGRPLFVHNTTFGLFENYFGGGKYGATCLLSCGNAADPEVYLDVDASRADGGYHITVGVTLAGNDALDASNKWEKVMVKNEGEDWVMDTKFNETNKYNAAASRAFSNVKITSIIIG